MDNASFGATCTGLKTQTYDVTNKCSVQKSVNENEEGCKSTNYHLSNLIWRLMTG